MPITKSAIKKQRADERKRQTNKVVRTEVLKTIKDFRLKPEASRLAGVFSVIDKAAKKNIFHTGKADRLKSRLSKLLKK